MKSRYLLLLMVLTIFAGHTVMAADYLFTDGDENDSLWQTDGNWSEPNSPGSSNHARVSDSLTVDIVSSTGAACNYLVVGNSSEGHVMMSGGSLTTSGRIFLSQAGDASFTMTDGTVEILDSDGARIGTRSGYDALLQIEGGTFTTPKLYVPHPQATTGTAKVNLFGGMLEVTRTDLTSLLINGDYNGSIEMRGDAILKYWGNRTAALNDLINNKGLIYAGEAGKSLQVTEYFETDGTTVLYCTVTVVDGAPTPMSVRFDNAAGDNLWSTEDNWTPRVPLDIDTAFILETDPNDCQIESGIHAAAANLWVGHGGQGGPGDLEMTGGSLTITEKTLGIGTDGTTGSFTMAGGDVYIGTENEGDIRFGYTGGEGSLTINGGIISTHRVYLPALARDPNQFDDPNSVGFIQINDGTLEIRWEADSGLLIEFENGYGTGEGSMEINGTGLLKYKGDKVNRLNFFKANGLISTSNTDPAKELVAYYDAVEDWTYMGLGQYQSTDLDKNLVVDVNDLGLFGSNWLETMVVDEINPNLVIYAPQISPITIDGDLSDWTESSDLAVFGKWYPNGTGLTSTTTAQYAWNDAGDILYIGVETTESNQPVRLEVGGLMGYLSNPTATVSDANEATQFLFQYNGSTVDITNQEGGSVSGISAVRSLEGSTVTFEIAVPIYSDWTTGTGMLDLTSGMDVYVYANLFDTNGDAADSQCADGVQVYYPNKVVTTVSSAVRLLNALPASCSDLPDTRVNPADFDADCVVNLKDFAVLASDWMQDYYPF